MRPLVSVVIPTFNRSALLCRAVDSVLSQSYDNVQVIVVDDGSRDGTRETVADRYGADQRVEYIHKANSGVSATRNVGLKHVKGDYIAFLDSDDEWAPWKLEIQMACFAKLPNVSMIWTNMDVVDSAGNITSPHCMRDSYAVYKLFSNEQIFGKSESLVALLPGVADPEQNTRIHWGDAFHAMALGNLCQPSTVIVTRECAEKVGGFNETMWTGEDHEYHLRAARVGNSVLIDAASSRYRRGANDQLAKPANQIEIARNYLRTIKAVVANRADRKRVDVRLLKDRIASAHSWIADEALDQGGFGEARRNYFQSLLVKPAQPRIAMKLAVSLLPTQIVSRLLASRTAARPTPQAAHQRRMTPTATAAIGD